MQRSRKPEGRRSTGLVQTQRLQGERGSSLIIAMCFLLVIGLVVSALAGFAFANLSATKAYRSQRAERYAGDAALQAGINYIRTQRLMGRDPNYSNTDPPCVYKVTTDTTVGPVSVTCAAEPGSTSGIPDDPGKVPDNAILALGQRHNETGPFNGTACESGFFGSSKPESEPSIFFRPGEIRDHNEIPTEIFNPSTWAGCQNRQRANDTFNIKGNVVGAGTGRSTTGSVGLLPYLKNGVVTQSQMKLRNCGSINIIAGGGTCTATTNADRVDPGAGPNATIKSEWAPVPIDWTVRTGGYSWNATNNTLVGNASCANKAIIILLPGWYKNADSVNKYTSNPACKEVTLWLAPNPGTDGIPMTADDKTGAFYFDFTEDTGTSFRKCSNQGQSNGDAKYRWCIGGQSASANIRVVTGTPDGWNPLGFTTGVPARTVVMNRANTVDANLTATWFDGDKAKSIDNQSAFYQATNYDVPLLRETCSLLNLCFATSRDVRVRDFYPKVAGAADDGKIYVSVKHRETSSTLSDPNFKIRTVSPDSGNTTNCPDTYRVAKSTGTLRQDQLLLGTSANAADLAAASIGACLNSADLINGMQITMTVTGDRISPKNTTKVFLDGYRVQFVSTPGATFPLPDTEPNADPDAARRDCDPKKPGGQIIFGGQTHVYVPDGSLEVCAGAYPTAPGDHQRIGIYGIPAVPPLLGDPGQSVTNNGDSGGSVSNAAAAKDIAEPDGRSDATINYSSNYECPASWFFGTKNCAGLRDYSTTTNVPITPYARSNYPNLELDTLTARVTYNPKNTDYVLGLATTNDQGACRAWAVAKAILSLGFANNLNCGRPQLQIGSCVKDAPLSTTLRSWQVDVTGCVTETELTNGITARWITHTDHRYICVVSICGNWNKSKSEQLDGIELLVGLRQKPGSPSVPVPQKGCVVQYPNYWEGAGSPDCALVKADSIDPKPISILGINITSDEAKWLGRYSVEGTIYAPSSAIEVDELDAAYPTASRGIVVSHMRVKGYNTRGNYALPAVSIETADTVQPRVATVVSCIRGVPPIAASDRTNVTTPCDASLGDRILSRARVQFTDPPASNTTATTSVSVRWWTDDR